MAWSFLERRKSEPTSKSCRRAHPTTKSVRRLRTTTKRTRKPVQVWRRPSLTRTAKLSTKTTLAIWTRKISKRWMTTRSSSGEGQRPKSPSRSVSCSSGQDCGFGLNIHQTNINQPCYDSKAGFVCHLPPTFSTTYLQKLTTYRKGVDLALPFC